ncbi:LexA-binding, inner membrane-associated putative hydrolase [Methanococcoides vulcani]|uniref:LexA-binding, inner membrane-associated putative hydrolase n=1 Tax=Methanococcoides vulcani TaxID=1353158 RepID=A0A1H9Z5W8_9EURY|nr:metal-dependent hydrolase [Methanococcoides vulcani]SES76898.1 LexA-binding, inner membrane-associated putative hydrolase [Methanococcoides vulcani]
MFILGHIGVTLTVFFLASLAFPSLKRHLDYRFIALGALLPDLIDKAIGRVLFEDVFASGRLFAHTLVFVIVILVAGYVYFRQRGDSRIMLVAGASFLHLLEDRMWMTPQTFFWPIFGWEFAQGCSCGSFLDYFMNIVKHVYSPDLSFALVSEVIGLLAILFLVYEHRK